MRGYEFLRRGFRLDFQPPLHFQNRRVRVIRLPEVRPANNLFLSSIRFGGEIPARILERLRTAPSPAPEPLTTANLDQRKVHHNEIPSSPSLFSATIC